MSLCRLYKGGRRKKISLNCSFVAKVQLLRLKYGWECVSFCHDQIPAFPALLSQLFIRTPRLYSITFHLFLNPAANRDKLKEKSHEMDFFKYKYVLQNVLVISFIEKNLQSSDYRSSTYTFFLNYNFLRRPKKRRNCALNHLNCLGHKTNSENRLSLTLAFISDLT
jgi:hypothetical protein